MGLRDLREGKKMSRTELSACTGISFAALHSYERGDRDVNGMNIKYLLKLCDTLDCTPADIVTDKEIIELLKKIYKKP